MDFNVNVNMCLLDMFLQLDVDKLTRKPSRGVELKRLSDLLGARAIFKCQALDGQTYADIQRRAIGISKRGSIKDIDIYEMQVMTALEGVIEPSFKDKKLLDHFNAPTPKDLVKKMLLPGEIAELHNVINELSGYERDNDEEDEIKN